MEIPVYFQELFVVQVSSCRLNTERSPLTLSINDMKFPVSAISSTSDAIKEGKFYMVIVAEHNGNNYYIFRDVTNKQNG